MKKLLVLAALTMAAAPAMASKARMGALGNAAHLIDVQTMFVNPADINYTGDLATLEFGNTQQAEGGFVRGATWGTLGAYLGHNTANLTGVNEQNALDLFYGADLGGMKWAVNLHYTNAKNEGAAPAGSTFTNQKESSLGINLGVRTDMWNAYLRATPTAKQETITPASTDSEYDSHYTVGGGAWFDSLYVYAQYFTSKDKAPATAVETTNYKVGVNENKKIEGGNFFYGIAYASDEVKDNKKVTALPLTMGIELDAASWLVLRASATQSVILQETETKVPAPTKKSQLLNDTTVAAGAGIKFGKMTLDGMISTTGGATPAPGSTGTIDANNTLSQVSLTYLF